MRPQPRGRGECSSLSTYSNKRSKTLTPEVEEVGEDVGGDNDYNSLPTEKAVSPVAIQSFQESFESFEACIIDLNRYHKSGEINDGEYMRDLTFFQTETLTRTAFLIVVKKCQLTWLKKKFGGGR